MLFFLLYTKIPPKTDATHIAIPIYGADEDPAIVIPCSKILGFLTLISLISSTSSLFEAHAHEFYMAWLDNISISLLRFTKE